MPSDTLGSRRDRRSGCYRLIAALALLLLAAAAPGEDRFVRYKLVSPQVSSLASVLVQPHVLASETQPIPPNWTGFRLPGWISRSSMYVPANEWSDWYPLPSPPVWGTIDLELRTAKPLDHCTLLVQVATPYAEEPYVIKELTLDNPTGNRVGFTLPRDLLENVQWIESMQDGVKRRRAVAQSVAVPPEHRPKLIQVHPSGVRPDPTLADSLEQELQTIRLLGFNTLGMGTTLKASDFRYRVAHGTGEHVERDAKAKQEHEAKYGPEAPPLAVSVLYDEPAWYSGFRTIWARTGEQGFRDYLRQQKVDPKLLGAKSMDLVKHIPRDTKDSFADATVERRRLWYWSCRYAYHGCAQFFREQTQQTHQTWPDALTTVNYSSHTITLFTGMLGTSGPDYFEMGRVGALDIQASEDWMFHGLNSWGNGLWQRMSYLTELLRAAGKLQPTPPPFNGMYVIPNGWNPGDPGTDMTVGVRFMLELAREVKHFGLFTYGPTSRSTIDFWGDNAPAMRGLAEAVNLIGKPDIEPFLWEGKRPDAQVALIYSNMAEIFLRANDLGKEPGQEKQFAFIMLEQEHVPVDILPSREMAVKPYKAAMLVDMNLERASAPVLRKWVESGGTLLLWHHAASRDEYNEPLDTFNDAAAPGRHALGKGVIHRFDRNLGHQWFESTRQLNEASDVRWAAQFDETIRRELVSLVEAAGVTRPVRVDQAAVVAGLLVGPRAHAVTLANLRGIQAQGGTRYPNVTVTLTDGRGVTRAVSSRHGELPLQRQGDSVQVQLPLDVTDVLVFHR